MDAAHIADEEHTQDSDEQGYVEIHKPNDGSAATPTRPVRSLSVDGDPAATSSHPAGSPAGQRVCLPLEREMEASKKFLQEALRSRRFPDALRYQLVVRKSRQGLSEWHPFSLEEKLDMNHQHATILRECNELHTSTFPCDLDELERNAHRLDPRKWGELCAIMGSLYMRGREPQDLKRAKTYLQLALTSLAKLDPSSLGILLPISQDLADVYNLQGDLGGADEYFKGNSEVDIRRMDRVNSWCENRGFKVGRFETQDPERRVSPLQLAVKQQHAEMFEIMLSFTQRTVPKDTISSIASDLLLFAADTRNTHIAKRLIDVGAKVDTLDPHGRSGLHRCQFCPEKGNEGGLKMAELFLERKRSLINYQDRQGKTALTMACEAAHVPMAELLLEYGSDPTLPDMHGRTCLYAACEKGDLEIVRVLLRAAVSGPTAQGLDINARGPGGCTPIILAVRAASTNRKKVSIVKELMRHNADPSIRDYRGNDAFRYVAGLAAREIEQSLKQPSLQRPRSSAPFSSVTRTRSQSASDSRIERTSASLLPTDHTSTAAGRKRSKVMGFWSRGQPTSNVSLAPSSSSYGRSSGFRSIFSYNSSNSQNTAPSNYTLDTPRVQSLLEVDEGAEPCEPSDGDAESQDSHRPSSPHPTQPDNHESPGQRTYESADEPEDEPEGKPTTISKEPRFHENCYCSSANADDVPTPSDSDVVSVISSDECIEAKAPKPELHCELTLRPSSLHSNHYQLHPASASMLAATPQTAVRRR